MAERRPAPTLLHSTAWSFFGSLLAVASRFAAQVMAARLLGPQRMGTLVYLLWVADMVNIAVSLGAQNSLTRFVAELRGRGEEAAAASLARWIYLRYLLLLLLGLALIAALARSLHVAEATPLAWGIAAAYFFFQSLNMLYASYLAGWQRFDRSACFSLLSGLALVAGVGIGGACAGLPGVVAGYLLGALIPGLFSFAVLRAGKEGPPPDRALQRRLLIFSGWSWLAAFSTALTWFRLELFFLERYWDVGAVAMFGVGLSLAALAGQGPTMLCGALLPHFAWRSGAADSAGLRRDFSVSTRLLAYLVFPASLILSALAPALIPQLYGARFAAAVPAATVLLAGSAVYFASVIPSLLYGLEKSRFIAVCGLAAGALSLAAGFVVIRPFGPLGAAASRAAVQLLTVAASFYYLHRRLACPAPWAALGRTALAALAAAALSGGVLARWPGRLGLAVAAAAGGALYLWLTPALRLLAGIDLAPRLERLAEPWNHWLSRLALRMGAKG